LAIAENGPRMHCSAVTGHWPDLALTTSLRD